MIEKNKFAGEFIASFVVNIIITIIIIIPRLRSSTKHRVAHQSQ